MKQIYAALFSSVLGVACSPAVTTATDTKIPATPEPINVTSLADLAAEMYQEVGTLPGQVFPSLSDERGAFDYGKFEWVVFAKEITGLQYVAQHKLTPLMVHITDYNNDGIVNSVEECIIVDKDNDGSGNLTCVNLKSDKVSSFGIVNPLENAQVLYEKMLKDTPAALAGKDVTADLGFSTAYSAILPEEIRV